MDSPYPEYRYVLRTIILFIKHTVKDTARCIYKVCNFFNPCVYFVLIKIYILRLLKKYLIKSDFIQPIKLFMIKVATHHVLNHLSNLPGILNVLICSIKLFLYYSITF